MSEIARILDLAGVKSAIVEETAADNISVFIKAHISYYVADREEVDSYRETNDERHGNEVHWDDSWERDAISELARSRVQLETGVGIFDTVDWDPQERSLQYGSGGLWYEGLVEFWVNVPREIAKSKEHVAEILKNSKLLIFVQGNAKPTIITPEKLDIFDYDFSDEFYESFNR